MLLVGVIDYLTGYEISLLIFYLLPVALAVWFVSSRFAVLISISSICIWLVGGHRGGSRLSPSGRHRMERFHRDRLLSGCDLVAGEFATVHFRTGGHGFAQRTAALTEEMTERARLEIEILEISEREQRRIGHDLHDGLGQHLTGTALASRVVIDGLATQDLHDEADKVERIAGMIQEAIDLTRSPRPRPVACSGGSRLGSQLPWPSWRKAQSRNSTCRASSFVIPRCGSRTRWPPRISIASPQEAIANAIRHGRASRVDLALAREQAGDGLVLTIQDNGVGLPAPARRGRDGMGLRIMAHRARMIDATLEVERGPDGGCVVRCRMTSSAMRPSRHEQA